MIKKIFFILLFILLVSCSQQATEKNNLDDINSGKVIGDNSEKYVTINSEKEYEIFSKIDLECETNIENPVYEWNIPCTTSICEIGANELGTKDISCKVNDLETKKTINVVKRKLFVDNVYVLGDSLSYGENLYQPEVQNWAYLLNEDYKQSTLHNYAVSGSTAFGLENQINNFKNEYESGNNLVFMWIGSNDAKNLIDLNEFESKYENNVKEILSKDQNLILLNVPDVSKLRIADDIQESLNSVLSDANLQVAVDLKELSKEVVNDYNMIIYKIANKYNVKVIDMFNIIDNFDNSLMSDDYFHPNKNGHNRIKEIVEKELYDLEEYDIYQ